MKVKAIRCLSAVLTLCLSAVIFICGFALTPVYAQTNGYSEVLYDLGKSKNFNISDYPVRQGDYSLKVITYYAYLTYTDRVEHNGGGLFAGTYTWDRIETVDEFISENEGWQNVYSGAIIDVNVGSEITEEGKAALKGKKWVLRFAETDYSLNSGYGSVTSFSTLVGDVTILRLKFETGGEVYNLGVVDNKQTGSDKPINNEWISAELSDNFKLILSIILLVLVLLLLLPVFKLVFKGIGKLFYKRDKQDYGGRNLDKMSREEVEKELDQIDRNSDFWKNIDGTDGG